MSRAFGKSAGRHHYRSQHVHWIRCSSTSVKFVPYTPVQKTSSYDLRLIQPHTIAKTSYQRRDVGFLSLGSYMSGANDRGIRCFETQPIIMTFRPDGSKTMQLYIVPKDDEDQSAPIPSDTNSISLDIAGGELIAAIRFEGNATKEVCEHYKKKLQQALEKDQLSLADAETFRLAQYGPIHSLSTRINEIWLTVKL